MAVIFGASTTITWSVLSFPVRTSSTWPQRNATAGATTFARSCAVAGCTMHPRDNNAKRVTDAVPRFPRMICHCMDEDLCWWMLYSGYRVYRHRRGVCRVYLLPRWIAMVEGPRGASIASCCVLESYLHFEVGSLLSVTDAGSVSNPTTCTAMVFHQGWNGPSEAERVMRISSAVAL